jgi:hypothetical protein
LQHENSNIIALMDRSSELQTVELGKPRKTKPGAPFPVRRAIAKPVVSR